MSDLKEKICMEFGKEIDDLIADIKIASIMINAFIEEGGYEFIDIIIEKLKEIYDTKQKTEECEKDKSSEIPELKELKSVKVYKIGDFVRLNDAQIAFEADEKFLKEQLAKDVMKCMRIERTWGCLGHFKITASIWVQK